MVIAHLQVTGSIRMTCPAMDCMVHSQPMTLRTALEWSKEILSSRHMPIVLAVMVFLISLPTLGAGWILDDWFQRTLLLEDTQGGLRGLTHTLDKMFILFDPGPVNQALQEQGVLPWWTSPDLRVSVWRPLSALTHWLDFRLFPDSAWPMHVHNLVWLALAVVSVAYLYRRIIGPVWIAGLASLMYALDQAHYFTAMWIANRNELIAVALGALALIGHHRWRTQKTSRHLCLGLIAFGGAVFATEAGIATLAYLAAYSVTLDRAPWLDRLKAILPYGLVLVGWRLLYNVTGHGTGGNGFMIDPVCAPWAYLQAVVTRYPILFAGQLDLVQLEVFNSLSSAARVFVIAGSYTAIGILLWALRSVWRSSAIARFWLIGMSLSVLPISASVPLTRNLMFVAIGAFGWIAQSASIVWSEGLGTTSRRSRQWGRLACGGLLLNQLPFTAAERLVHPQLTDSMLHLLGPAIPADLTDLKGRTLVVVNGHNPFGLMYFPMMTTDTRDGGPQRLRVLAPGWRTLEVHRSDERTLILRTQGGNLFKPDPSPILYMTHLYKEFASLARPLDQPFEPNHTYILSDMEVQVRALDERCLPREITIRFNAPLDDPSLRWVEYDWSRFKYRVFNLPPVGQTYIIPGPKCPSLSTILDFIQGRISSWVKRKMQSSHKSAL